MADAGDRAMRALMGFSSFGRPRKRMRRTSDTTDGNSTGDGADWHRQELHHVAPGTIVESTSDSLPASSVRLTPHSIALLLQQDRQTLDKVLKCMVKAQEVEKSDSGAVTSLIQAWCLPSSSIELLATLEATKASFEQLEAADFATARRRANPFEALGRHRFINRSAMKMANLDFLFAWTASHQIGEEPFMFADVCGGPGGFSEYLLWRMAGEADASSGESASTARAVGFGITLKGAPWCDWKLDVGDETSTSRVQFHICEGADGSGDLYKIDNIYDFQDKELLMTRLVMAETLTMFAVLQVGGSFLCKTFELSSPLMLQLLWLVHACFEELTIVKPVTSRPASSERYIVAQYLLPNLPLESIRRELERVVQSLEREDPLQVSLLSGGLPSSSSEWYEFVVQASDRFARQQIRACEKIIAFAAGSAVEPGPKRPPVIRVDQDKYYQAWRVD